MALCVHVQPLAHALLARSVSLQRALCCVCRSPFCANHGMNQTLPVPLLITYSFSSRWWLAHISPSPSEKSVPIASSRGPASALCLVRAPQVQVVKMCTHRSTIGLKGWVPGGLGAIDGGQNLCRLSLHKPWQQGRRVRESVQEICLPEDWAGSGTER